MIHVFWAILSVMVGFGCFFFGKQQVRCPTSLLAKQILASMSQSGDDNIAIELPGPKIRPDSNGDVNCLFLQRAVDGLKAQVVEERAKCDFVGSIEAAETQRVAKLATRKKHEQLKETTESKAWGVLSREARAGELDDNQLQRLVGKSKAYIIRLLGNPHSNRTPSSTNEFLFTFYCYEKKVADHGKPAQKWLTLYIDDEKVTRVLSSTKNLC